MKKRMIRHLFSLSLFFLLSGNSFHSFAVDDEPPPSPSETTKTCLEGQIWSPKEEKCIKIEEHKLDDHAIYNVSRELAYHGRYHDSITLLRTAKNQKDPKILNYLGFAHRKIGKLTHAMEYYSQALAIDPNYIVARSYMGQGYLSLGKEHLAIAQLKEIKNRGGKNTWAYVALKDAINKSNYAY